MYNPAEIAEYYNTTHNHYMRWWKLRKQNSLHYGIRDANARTFSESLINTNRIMMEHAGISENDKILDAGCGVGGAAFYLAKMKNTEVTGISLSDRQINYARHHLSERYPDARISFRVMDFTKTSFPDESFDIVWACESVCQADKAEFARESFRLLKKGGRLIIADFFLTPENRQDRHEWIRKWCDTWAVSELVSGEIFSNILSGAGFVDIGFHDYTKNIRHSAKRMFFASLFGAIPSELYNLFHPEVTRFARSHYKCGYYQYKALQEGLWKYNIITAGKKDADSLFPV